MKQQAVIKALGRFRGLGLFRFLRRVKNAKFFRSKKFFIFLGLGLLLFFFTPVSFYQAGRRVEEFINQKALAGVRAFEGQTGLKIQWKSLKLRLFPLSVELKEVSLLPLHTPNFKKIQELRVLDGLQRVQKIKASPSLYSLLFKKRIFLSRLVLQEGEICLKTAIFSAKRRPPSEIEFPVGRLLIKDTRVNIARGERSLQLSSAGADIAQRKTGVFDLKLVVKDFRFSQNQQSLALVEPPFQAGPAQAGAFNAEGFAAKGQTAPLFCGRSQSLHREETAQTKLSSQGGGLSPSFSFLAYGRLQKTGARFKNIVLKGQGFESQTSALDLSLVKGDLKKLVLQSSGSLPSSLLKEGFIFFGKSFFPLKSLISYKAKLEYLRARGFKGSFEISGQDALFKDMFLRRFSLKGRLSRFVLLADSGSVKTKSYGSFSLKKARYSFKKPFSFMISAQTDRLSSHGVRQALFPDEDLPLRGDLTGQADCSGQGSFQIDCELSGLSQEWALLGEEGENLISVHDMSLDSRLSFKEGDLSFEASGSKPDSFINFKGQAGREVFLSSYSFAGRLGEDLKIKAPFPLKGRVAIQEGSVRASREKIESKAVFSSPLLKINGFNLKNIGGAFELQNNKLAFSNLKGLPGGTSWTGDLNLDFAQQSLALRLDMPFLDLRDGVEAMGLLAPPFPLKGTGSLSLALNYPWALPERKSFRLKAGLFNIQLGNDFFQQGDFDFALNGGQGDVRSFFVQKGQGHIQGSGSYGPDFSLDVDLAGRDLSLEGLEFLNQILPFNQTGDLSFDMKLKGTLTHPEAQAEVWVKNTLLYSYPAKDSRGKLSLTRKDLSFSGVIMDQIFVENFIYPFSQKSQISAVGQFKDFNFVQVLLAKDRKERAGDYSSKISGSFSLKRLAQKGWFGSAQISDFMISRPPRFIKSSKAFSLFFAPNRWSASAADFYHNDDSELSLEPMENEKLLLTGQSSLGLFSVFLPFVEEWEGQVQGRLLADNNLLQLNPAGSVRIEKGLFLMKFLPEFSGIRGHLILSKNNIFIKSLKARAGGGRLEGEGSVFYDFLNPPDINLNLKFFKAHLNIPEDFNTRGSGEISIRGERPPYLISGNYLIDSGVVTKEFSGQGAKGNLYDFSFAEERKKQEPSLFHLKWGVKTLQPVVVENSFIKSAIQGQTDIYGPLDSLRMKGRFHLSSKEGENLIFFRGREFKIQSGSILFEDSPPENPYLNIKALSSLKETIRDPLEDSRERVSEYKILLSLKGPSQDPVFSLKSDPNLNEKEIISLLALGVGYRHFDAYVEQNISDYSYHIGSLVLERFLNREFKRASGWDVRLPSYISSSNETDWKIVLSRNWFKKWKTSFSRTLEKSQSDARLKYSLNPAVSLTAFWENREDIDQPEESFENRMGLDFEFEFNF